MGNNRMKERTCSNGRISVAEYMDILDAYGVEISDGEIERVVRISDKNGRMSKDDFIQYVKSSNMYLSLIHI